LLIKFIDAKEDLSIQVHPNDQLARERHNSLGKTEMWYILQSDPDSRIIIGFKEPSSPEEYLKHLHEKTLTSILDQVVPKPGDVFFLPTGTVHAIGGGIMLAEIQQTSDITYRVYDWDRVDAEGKSRELHIDLALDAINYDVVPSKRDYSKEKNRSNLVVDCPYFTTNFILLAGEMEIDSNPGMFRIFMCVEGKFEIATDEIYQYCKGDTILIPASMPAFSVKGNASILEIYIS
jgi:mannose-6-phosphate isomerase